MSPVPIKFNNGLASSILGENFNALIPTVDSFAAARLFNAEPGMRLYIAGAASQGDGSQGMFSYTVGAVADNGTSILNITGSFPPAYWLRLDESGSSNTTGPYPGQLPQTFSQSFNAEPLNIFSYLTLAQQTAVQNGTSVVDFSPILTAASAAATFNSVNGVAPGVEIYFPPGKYPFLSTVNLKHQCIIRGAGGGGTGASTGSTLFTFPINTIGIIVNTRITLGSTTISSTTGADGTVIRDLAIQAVNGSTISETPNYYGIWLRGRGEVIDCTIGGFAFAQVFMNATSGSGGSTEGNANGWLVDTCALQGNSLNQALGSYMGMHGLYVSGNDSNAGESRHVDGRNFIGWSIKDNSGLGNTHSAPEAAQCGLASFVNQGGASYTAYPTTTSATLSATTPGTNSTVWYPNVHGFNPTWPAWSALATYYTGGHFWIGGDSATQLVLNAYGESDAVGPSWAGQKTIVINGIESQAGNSWIGSGLLIGSDNSGGYVNSLNGGGFRETNSSAAPHLGGEGANGTVLYTAGNGWRLKVSGSDMQEDYANLGSDFVRIISGLGTSFTFGYSAAKPLVTFSRITAINDIAAGANTTLSSVLVSTSGTPSSTGGPVGQFAFNRTGTETNAFGYSLKTQSGGGDTWIARYTLTSLSITGGGLTQSTAKLLGRTTASTGAVEEIGTGAGLSLSAGSLAVSGAATASGLTMATSRILGRTTASTGAIEEITVGNGLLLSGGSLAVAPAATQANSTAPDVATLVTDFNALLAKLKAANLMSP